MRPIRLGMIAALALALAAPASVMAAPKKDPRAELMAAKAREKGQAEAPALAQAMNLPCDIGDARWMGEDKTQSVNIYEVACKTGMSFVLLAKADTPTQAFTCLETARPGPDGQPNTLKCELPGTNDPKAALAPFVTKAGRPCAVDKARAIGQGQKSAYFEVACEDGAGFIMVTSTPPDPAQPVQMNTCLAYEPGGSLFCELTDRASQLSAVDQLVATSGRTCQITNRRYVLSTKAGSNFYEIACGDDKGYMVEENAAGGLARILDCGSADFIGGGCTMTDARAAKTEQANLYTRLAKKAGFDCDVAKYAPLPTTGSKEVVELSCDNRPDGGIAILTAQGGTVLNCVLAELEGYRCSFTEKAAVFPKLTANLKTLGKTSCVVSDARVVGKTADEGFIEVACSDGLPGWVIGYPISSDKPKEVLGCLQAANIGAGCKLPTNRRG